MRKEEIENIEQFLFAPVQGKSFSSEGLTVDEKSREIHID
jgi:hypothetical protein